MRTRTHTHTNTHTHTLSLFCPQQGESLDLQVCNLRICVALQLLHLLLQCLCSHCTTRTGVPRAVGCRCVQALHLCLQVLILLGDLGS